MAGSGFTLSIPSVVRFNRQNAEFHGPSSAKTSKDDVPSRGSSVPPMGSRRPPPLPLPSQPVLLSSSETISRPGSRLASAKNVSAKRSSRSPSVVNGSPSSGLSKTIDKVFADSLHTGELDLSNRSLKYYPDDVAENHDLMDTIKTDLSRNRLSELSEKICDLSSLEHLNLYHNTLRCLPTSMSQLHNLVYLNVSRNMLSMLPESISQLDNLEVLLASSNRLVSLPGNIGHLSHLMHLDVSCNVIDQLPQQLMCIDSLCSLNFRRNHITQLPGGFRRLKRLRSLDISCNRITHIPSEFCQLTSLEDIQIYNNPLIFPPSEMCDKGCAHLLNYLSRGLLRDRRKPLNQSVHQQSHLSLGSSDGELNGKDINISPVVGSSPESCSSSDLRKESDWLLIATNKMVDSGYYTTVEAGDQRFNKNASNQGSDVNFMSKKLDKSDALISATPSPDDSEKLPDSSYSCSSRTPHTNGLHASDDMSLSNGHNGECSGSITDSLWLQNKNSNCANTCTVDTHSVGNETIEHNEMCAARAENQSIGESLDTSAPHGAILDPPDIIQACDRSNIGGDIEEKGDNRCVNPMLIFQQSLSIGGDGEREEVIQLKKLIESILKIQLPRDLGAALSDGIILCQLVNHILPSSVPTIHIPSSTTLPLSITERGENVTNFLRACQMIGVDEAMLCEVEDVVGRQNVHGVVETFRHLISQCLAHEHSAVRHSCVGLAALRNENNQTADRNEDRVVAAVCLLCFALAHVILFLFPLSN